MVTGFWRGPAGAASIGGGSVPTGQDGQVLGYGPGGELVAVDLPEGGGAGPAGPQGPAGPAGPAGADGETPDVSVFAAYADALAYSTANPAAIVFSQEEAP